MARAVWNGVVLAESDDIVMVEGNLYFPRSSLNNEYFTDSPSRTVCPWKGLASYFDVVVDGRVNRGAAWFNGSPSPAAADIKDRVAFWRGIEVQA